MTAEESIKKSMDNYVSSVANNLLEFHAKEPVKELTDFASQAVEDYKEKLKAEVNTLRKNANWLEVGVHDKLLKLIDSIK